MHHQTGSVFWRAASIIQASCLDYSLNYKANKFCRLVFNCFVRAHLVHPDILFNHERNMSFPMTSKLHVLSTCSDFHLSARNVLELLNCCLTAFSAAGSFPTPNLFWNITPHHVHPRSDYLTCDNINTPYRRIEGRTTQAHQKKKKHVGFIWNIWTLIWQHGIKLVVVHITAVLKLNARQEH